MCASKMDRAFGRVVNSKLVILESNWDVRQIYKENEPNSFVTKFFDPLEFDGSWEVAISEISYPLYLQNYSKTDLLVMEWPKTIDVLKDPNAALRSVDLAEYDVSIPSGYYSSPQKLGNRLISEFLEEKQIRKLKEPKRNYSLSITSKLQEVHLSLMTAAMPLQARIPSCHPSFRH